MVPDGTFATKIVSPEFEVMLQRHGSLKRHCTRNKRVEKAIMGLEKKYKLSM